MISKWFPLCAFPLIILFGLWIFMAISPQSVYMQTNCPQIPSFPSSHPRIWCWSESARVRLVINSDPNNRGFTPTQIQAIRAAFDNWNAAKEFSGNCSLVTFGEQGITCAKLAKNLFR
jgi:hypothetical protein